MHGESDDDRREHGFRDHSRGEDRWNDSDGDEGMMLRGGRRNWSDADRSANRAGDFGGTSRGFGSSHLSGAGRGRLSAHPDDHYRSWRERHMSELDRDYEDYCREREQAFHQDFDTWRSQRHANYQPLRTGMTQSGMSHDPSGELQLTTEAEARDETDPMGAATLGTNSSAETRGRGGR
jgi:hypothetical protein